MATPIETYAARIAKMTANEVRTMRVNAEKANRADIAALCTNRMIELEKTERRELRGVTLPPGSVEDLILRVHEQYEAVKSLQLGRRFVATRTRPMFERWGIVGTAERTVTKGVSGGFEALVREGQVASTWEAVIAAFPEHFSHEARNAAYGRLSLFLTSDQIESVVKQLHSEAAQLAQLQHKDVIPTTRQS